MVFRRQKKKRRWLLLILLLLLLLTLFDFHFSTYKNIKNLQSENVKLQYQLHSVQKQVHELVRHNARQDYSIGQLSQPVSVVEERQVEWKEQVNSASEVTPYIITALVFIQGLLRSLVFVL